MSRFKVGDRVKLVRPKHLENFGRTGVIKSFFTERMGVSYAINCDVDWDTPPSKEFTTATHTSRLEPITDSYDLASWDTCICKPEHLRVKV